MKEYKYKINGNQYTVTVGDIEDNMAQVEVNGTPYKVELDKPIKVAPKPIARPAQVSAPVVAAPKPKSGGGAAGAVKSPLPGVILQVKVKEGDMVNKGDTLLILEAMKMENNIAADHDGKVVSIKVANGESVLEGADLVVIE